MDRDQQIQINIRLMAQLMMAVGELAKIVREMLDNDQMTPEERKALRVQLSLAIQGIATQMNQELPGSGEQLSRIFHSRRSTEPGG